MHIPDGFLSGSVNIVGAVTAAGVVGVSVWRASREAERQPHTVPLLSTTGAFVFAAQMLNFPIGVGTSGHFLGAAAVAALLGPWRACLVMTLVLVIQALAFSDGGLTALGTNVFNMAIVGVMGAYWLMRALRLILPAGRTGYLATVAVSSGVSVLLAAAACALELAWSGTSPLLLVLPAMLGVHLVIGIGEALITCAVLSAVVTARPDILPAWANVDPTATNSSKHAGRRPAWSLAGAGLVVALLLATLISPLASGSPDGLERVAEDHQFAPLAEGATLWNRSILPDYTVPGIASDEVSTGLAGLLGTTAIFVAGFGLVKLLSLRRLSENMDQ